MIVVVSSFPGVLVVRVTGDGGCCVNGSFVDILRETCEYGVSVHGCVAGDIWKCRKAVTQLDYFGRV